MVSAGAAAQAASAAQVQDGLYQAARGEVNTVRITDTASGSEVVDLTAPLVLGPGCVAGPPVVCGYIRFAYLGDRDDRAERRSFFSDVFVYGQQGNDDVIADGLSAGAFGGAGDDRVSVDSNGFSEGAGGPGDDVVTGSGSATVTVTGGQGNDRLEGRTSGGGLEVQGGAGDDALVLQLNSSASGATAAGGPGNDSIAATGSAGGPVGMIGGAGDDVITGSTGADAFTAGPGDDQINSADGVAESVNCGAGVDGVTADALDTVARNCENVTIL
jgi:hypothetical protein